VIAQRLVRRICEAAPRTTPTRRSRFSSRRVERTGKSGYRKGKGCTHCAGAVTAGRVGVYEMLEIPRGWSSHRQGT